MPTLPEDAIRLAKQLAEEAREEEGSRLASRREAKSYPTIPPESPDLDVPRFLHERELADGLRVVTLLASGRNPFSPEVLDSLDEAQQVDVLRALAVVVCTLASTHERRARSLVEPLVDDVDPSTKRPLVEYLRRVEKEAILDALEESRHNQTEAARLLGITFRSLRYRIETLGIEL